MPIDRTPFRIYRGSEANIRNIQVTDGYVYFATDSGRIYTDYQGERRTMGGSGDGGNIALYYAFQANVNPIDEEVEESQQTFIIYHRYLEDAAAGVKAGDLIINSDGAFYKVLEFSEDDYICSRIAISGTGGGGGGGQVEQDLFLEYDGIDVLGSTYIYGQDNIITFEPRSTADSYVSLLLTAKDLDGVHEDVVRQTRLYNGDIFEFNTNLLPKSNNIEITVLINSPMAQYNKGKGLSLSFSPIRVLEMYIEKPADITMNINNANLGVSLPYIGSYEGLGGTNAPIRIHYSIDGAESSTVSTLPAAWSQHQHDLVIDDVMSHGMHTIRVWLSVTINDQEYNCTEIAYEVPIIETGNEMPIIWVKNELGTITNYEPAVVQYMVYSSVAEAQGSTVEVSLYKNNDLLNSEEVRYATGSWLSMDLTPYYEFVEDGVKENKFSLVCGSATKTLEFSIDDRGARDLSLVSQNRLRMSFDSMGRSNKEIRANRSKWASKVNDYEATLSGFNWYTNGWMNDNNGMGSYLSVANGASVSFPLPILAGESAMAMNTNAAPWTFEIRFRVRNAKKFATLVTEIPKYRYTVLVNGTKVPNDLGQEKTLEEIEAIPGAEPMLDEDGNMVMNEANTTKKIVQTEKYVAMKFLNARNEGFAIGTQEAYFNTAGSTVNVKYKENEIINISFVIDRQNDALSIYLNGILSGVGSLSAITAISMESSVKFEINSKYCDFDLYKFRVYPMALPMPDIIHNYIADIKDVNIYDENQLTDVNDPTALDYHALVKYNTDHPSDPTMPYCVIDMTATSQGTDLPHYKGAKRAVRIEFTNPVADYLLNSGQITPLKYYTHCPSFSADNVELNVQGTSSQKYPRRNFKAKFKKSENWIYSNGELAEQPVNEAYTLASGDALSANWHVDHPTIGSNAFTWKIDYMESSGSYNTGFANLMGSGIYDKHPLEDLGDIGVDASAFRVNVYGFPMLVFHKTAEDTYTYIGRYNMNLDKSSNERYGFEVKKAQPFLTWQREVERDKVDPNTGEVMLDPETGEPMKETVTENYHPNIKDASECWELRDNQGTWCSWRYPNAEMRAMGFQARMAGSTEADPKIEVAQHFEARYHPFADQFEYAQNIILGKENEKSYASDIGGDTASAASAYVYNKLQNLQVLFNWLDSTDTTNATNAAFETNVRQLVSGKLSKKVENPEFNYEDYVADPDHYDKPEFIYIDDTEAMAANGVTYEVVTENDVQRTYGIFTKDSVEYRRQKFYSEFNKHLDLHYCCVYFVMTELMLCYDSRGKNMMIASWGPREAGGDYIWYPIFYDIDTQLGLNNVGAKLWDYDEDCSENGTFSTKDSVLWTNLYDVFKSNILSTYRTLRNGKIDEATIENSYMCRAGTTFDSYAMMGKRPIIAIGLDIYYKYVLPVTQAWKDQTGNMVTANYLYACQGDRILSRELLIENRLLYMDSKWLGGTFTITSGGMAGINFRGTANKPTTTSDKYLDSQTLGAGQVYGQYPVPYYDATPEYMVTPYLNFYVTTFVDENTFQTDEAYSEAKYPNGIPTPVSSSVLTGYKSGNVDQQLNYFAGSQYISSLGDLSLKYLNEIHFPNASRLLDITLGSDAPEYFNAETLNPLELYTEVNVDGTVKPGHEKSLLQKINLNHMRGLNTYLDVRSPHKLEEFRALDTSLRYALFADGAPLNTVHLPATVTRLVFTQNKELTKLLTSEPVVADMVNGTLVYRPHESYEGLFVDGVTNYTDAMAGTGSLITELSFEGDALGYGSYTILKNVVARKNGTGRENRLSIRMADVKWTPYVQVEYGESKLVGETYYYLTDHSTYESYDRADEYWYEDTLNGKVYTYDSSMDESIITDLSLFQLFYDDKNNTPSNEINQYTNNIESMLNQQTYPTISGEVYISNASGTAIKESDLTDKYGVAFPNLKIRVANVDPAYIAKFVQVLPSGKEDEIDIIRYPHEAGQSVAITAKMPYKQYCDFLGWGLVKEPTVDSEWFVKYDYENGVYNEILTPQNFSDQKSVVTLYAIFREHPYIVTFRNPDDTIVATTASTYGQPVKAPDLIPATDESGLQLEETYKFKGYSREKVALNANDRQINAALVKLNQIYVTHDMELYVVYRKQSVFDEAMDDSYFEFTEESFNDTKDGAYTIPSGYKLRLKSGMQVSGKITLPNTHNNLPVVSVEGFASNGRLTHVFFMDNGSNLRRFEGYVFQNCSNLVWVDWPAGVRSIGQRAFMLCSSLTLSHKFNAMDLWVIEPYAFNQAFGAIETGVTELHIGGDFTDPAASGQSFSNLAMGARVHEIGVVFGGPGDPSSMVLNTEYTGQAKMLRNGDGGFASYTIYVTGTEYERLKGPTPDGSDYPTLWLWFLNQLGTRCSYFNSEATINGPVLNSAS